MLDDQKFALEQIVGIAMRERPDAVILAGDIYDKSMPAAEAVTVLDDFLVKLAATGTRIYVISGNHDSSERLAFASRLLAERAVFVSPVYDGTPLRPSVIKDDDGTEVAIHMLPFVKPMIVQHYACEDDKAGIRTYNDALSYVINHLMDVDESRRNVLITHQFITDAVRSESEDVTVGTLDNVDASLFDKFDYVALGHLHCPQTCGRETVRYSGSPLKYSFSEVDDVKSASIVEIKGTGEPQITTVPLQPLHDWYDLRGTYEELTAKSTYESTDYQDSYVRITLTDEDDIPDGMRRLKTIYHRLMVLQYDNKRTRAGLTLIGKPMNVNELNPSQLFAELFEKQNARPLDDEQDKYVNSLISQIFNK